MPLKVSDGMGAWIDDFKKSDAPQFKGKSDKERRDQAIAAYLSAKRGDKQEGYMPNYADKMKKKMMTPSDKDKLLKIKQMLDKEKNQKQENVKSADRKPEIYTKPDGKRGVRMVPTDREVVKTEGYVSMAQQRAVWATRKDGGKGHPDNKKKSKKEDASSDAVKAYMAKGGKVTKLPPGKAAGYHGKDDPGKDMHGVMDRGDTKQLPRKKVKSMEAKTRIMGESMQKEEMNFAVSIEGLPQMFISADSPGMLKQTLRKIVKQPSMIQNVKRVTDAQVKKTFRLKAQGRDEESEE